MKFHPIVAAVRRLTSLAPILLCLCVLSLPATAQSTRRTRRESNANRKARIARTIAQTYVYKWEVGGGGGYERFRSGQYKLHNNEITFWTSGLYSLSPKLGILGLVQGGFGSAKLGNDQGPFQGLPNPRIANYTFLAGPSYRFVRRQFYSVSGFVAGGAAYGNFQTGSKDPPPVPVGLWPNGPAAAFAVGADFDYNLFPNVSLRVTPEYLGTTFGSTLQNQKVLNFGVTYRFGNRR